MAHLIKAFRDFAPDLQQLRTKIHQRIQDLMETMPGRVFKTMEYGPSDTLGITNADGNVKVLSITYNFPKGLITLDTETSKAIDLMGLSHDDLNAIYENLYNNLVNYE